MRDQSKKTSRVAVEAAKPENALPGEKTSRGRKLLRVPGRNALIIILPALVAATLLATQAPAHKAALFLIGLFLGAVGGTGVVLFLRFRRSLGTATAVAAVSILSGIFFVLVAWGSPVCPAYEYSTRCPPFVLGNVAVTGALTPMLIAFCALPFILIFKLVRAVYQVKTGKRPGELKVLRRVLSATGIGPKETQGDSRANNSVPTEVKTPRVRPPRVGGEKKNVPTPKRPKRPTRPDSGRR